jgi:hypothetical protein
LKQIRWFCCFSADKTDVVIKAEMAAMMVSTTRSSIKESPAERYENVFIPKGL